MAMTPNQTFEEFREMIYTFRLPRIVLSAMDLDLFNKIGSRTWTIPQLAKRCQASRRGMGILCRNLASVGLLKVSQKGYGASPFVKQYLQSASPDFRGDYLCLIQRQWEEWSQLTDIIRSGQPVESQEADTPEYRRSFTWAMHHRSQEAAQQVAQQLRFPKARRLLDIGGGPGTYALAFLRRNPKLQATVMDRPAALEVASELAQSTSVGSRLSLQPGDFLDETIEGKFDVIWYSNVLHIYSPAQNLAIFKKIRKVLNPSGRLLIQDTFLENAKGLRPIEANLFAVTMLLYTESGNTYSVQDVSQWLTKARFLRPRIIRLTPGTGDWEGRILEGRAPSHP